MAYRNASIEFYDEADITEYRFLASLNPRTCLVCWRLHGTIWNLKHAPHIHTQCRCSVVPVVKRGEKVQTGVELFDELEAGYQKEILGNSRFEMFRAGATLETFVGVKKSEDFGQSYFVKSLAELSDG